MVTRMEKVREVACAVANLQDQAMRFARHERNNCVDTSELAAAAENLVRMIERCERQPRKKK